MTEDRSRIDHASRLNELTAQRAPSACGARHPLLREVWCERLRGHPGRHGAVADTETAELTLEWNEEEEAAHDGG
jgi:hypothetical protein